MDDSTATEAPLTTAIIRRVRPGQEAAFEAWLEGIIGAAARFAGHDGVTVLRPRPHGPREYTLVVRWRDLDSSRRWLESPERADWLERASPMVEHTERYDETGLEAWFTLPDAPLTKPPPRHKMALLTWAAIYPLLLLAHYGLGPILGRFATPIHILLNTLVLIPLMTWVVMPFMTRRFWGWLHPGVPRP